MVLLNTTTGAQVGNTLTQAGSGQATFNSDSSRVILSTNDYYSDSDQDRYTRFAVLDANTGAQVGSTITLAGNGGATFTADGARAIVSSYSNDSATTQVVLVDLATGTQGRQHRHRPGICVRVRQQLQLRWHQRRAGHLQQWRRRQDPPGARSRHRTYDDSTAGVVKNRTTIVAVT